MTSMIRTISHDRQAPNPDRDDADVPFGAHPVDRGGAAHGWATLRPDANARLGAAAGRRVKSDRSTVVRAPGASTWNANCGRQSRGGAAPTETRHQIADCVPVP
jgi:hypothetical protein